MLKKPHFNKFTRRGMIENVLIMQGGGSLGAILVMLAESMILEAFKEGGASRIGIAIMVGFAVAFMLGKI